MSKTCEDCNGTGWVLTVDDDGKFAGQVCEDCMSGWANITPRRDPAGIVLACFFLAGGIGWLAAAVGMGGWFWFLLLPAIFCLSMGAVGLAVDVQRLPRDRQGRPIRDRQVTR